MPDYLSSDNKIVRSCTDGSSTKYVLLPEETCNIIGEHTYYVDGDFTLKSVSNKRDTVYEGEQRIVAFCEKSGKYLNHVNLIGLLFSDGSLRFLKYRRANTYLGYYDDQPYCIEPIYKMYILATDGIESIHKKIIVRENDNEANENILVATSEGKILIFYVKGELYRKDILDFPSFAKIVRGFYSMVVLDSDGNIWYGSDRYGIFHKYNPKYEVKDVDIFERGHALVFLTHEGCVYHLKINDDGKEVFPHEAEKYNFSKPVKQIYCCGVYCNALFSDGTIELGCSNNILPVRQVPNCNAVMLPHQTIGADRFKKTKAAQ